LAASDASLATNFDGATPTEQVSPSSSSTRDRMRSAISGAGPSNRRARRTSRKASSREIGSTSGVNEVKIAMTRALTSP
jgi:hypothetical protein